MSSDKTRQNVIVLACCQGLLMIGTATMLAEAALVGHMLAENKALATLPLALQQIGVMAAMFPASFLMARVGRRLGFTLGALFGIVGTSIALLGVLWNSFGLFCLGSMLNGCYNGFGQFYRFAAVDGSRPELKSKAISYVLAGGVIAAIVGPEMAKATKDLWPAHVFAGSFAALIGVAIVALLLLQLIDIPRPSDAERKERGRSLREIAAQPVFLVAVLGGIVGYAGMSFVMTATPLAMVGHAHHFDLAASVIQWHVFAMFAPSFFTGDVIKRVGALKVMQTGAVLMIICVTINLFGTHLYNFWVALFILGIGWNFLFVGATTLLTETYRPAERALVQATNDFLIFGSVAIASIMSGIVLEKLSWQIVNIGVLPFVAATLAATGWLGWRRRASSVVGAVPSSGPKDG